PPTGNDALSLSVWRELGHDFTLSGNLTKRPAVFIVDGRHAPRDQTYSSSISPLISCERPIPPSVTTAIAWSLSFPLSLPSAKACRTAFSISRWAAHTQRLEKLADADVENVLVHHRLHVAADCQRLVAHSAARRHR